MDKCQSFSTVSAASASLVGAVLVTFSKDGGFMIPTPLDSLSSKACNVIAAFIADPGLL